MASFAKIAILGLVFYPIHGILITFPIAVIVHFFRNCDVITGFFFVGHFPERIAWCGEDILSSSLQIGRWKNNHCEKYTPSNCKESERDPSTPGQLSLHQSVLELLGSKPRNFWNPHSTRTSSCCFLEEQVEANLCLKNLVLPVLRTLSALPALSRPNETLRQVVFHLDLNDAPLL